jgi:hypothetical protein
MGTGTSGQALFSAFSEASSEPVPILSQALTPQASTIQSVKPRDRHPWALRITAIFFFVRRDCLEAMLCPDKQPVERQVAAAEGARRSVATDAGRGAKVAKILEHPAGRKRGAARWLPRQPDRNVDVGNFSNRAGFGRIDGRHEHTRRRDGAAAALLAEQHCPRRRNVDRHFAMSDLATHLQSDLRTGTGERRFIIDRFERTQVILSVSEIDDPQAIRPMHFRGGDRLTGRGQIGSPRCLKRHAGARKEIARGSACLIAVVGNVPKPEAELVAAGGMVAEEEVVIAVVGFVEIDELIDHRRRREGRRRGHLLEGLVVVEMRAEEKILHAGAESAARVAAGRATRAPARFADSRL